LNDVYRIAGLLKLFPKPGRHFTAYKDRGKKSCKHIGQGARTHQMPKPRGYIAVGPAKNTRFQAASDGMDKPVPGSRYVIGSVSPGLPDSFWHTSDAFPGRLLPKPRSAVPRTSGGYAPTYSHRQNAR